MACISCLSSKSLRGRARSESIEPEVKQLPERCDRSVRKKPDTGVKISSPVPSTHSGSSVGRSCESCDYDFATFASTVQVARLPVVVFDDEVEEQLIWDDCCVKNGVVSTTGAPDIRVKNPVVMSNAFKGFVVQPYETRYLHFRDVGIIFARPPGGRFMQPSIDTMLVCRALVDSLKTSEVKRVIDVGSGSGFIGKFVAHHARGEGELEVALVDIDRSALKYYEGTTFNSGAVSSTGRSICWKFLAEDAVAFLNRDPDFDLIVSNPPYIPTRPECSANHLSPLSGGFWEGVGLVSYLLTLISRSEKPKAACLVIMVTSLTLKAPAVLEALEDAEKKGCKLKVLLEREIAWKAWYAGPYSLDHLLATAKEQRQRHKVAGCEFFLGATPPGHSRTGLDGRDQMFGYHWHFAYVLEVQAR
eukprot:CAMPEP_0181446546 /NCGR_PEP_ID=MMETSP1110-20121109/26160_1 /TAXON_ID=174948 /ORGANISM="Symbiodinium sp., Strain CCMP421" /LENGTH=416 /DNA_ID=CAMNT_0023570627 /DNA_START=36 /DNA_END=1287 /DNA_ORIENTATION=-